MTFKNLSSGPFPYKGLQEALGKGTKVTVLQNPGSDFSHKFLFISRSVDKTVTVWVNQTDSRPWLTCPRCHWNVDPAQCCICRCSHTDLLSPAPWLSSPAGNKHKNKSLLWSYDNTRACMKIQQHILLEAWTWSQQCESEATGSACGSGFPSHIVPGMRNMPPLTPGAQYPKAARKGAIDPKISKTETLQHYLP